MEHLRKVVIVWLILRDIAWGCQDWVRREMSSAYKSRWMCGERGLYVCLLTYLLTPWCRVLPEQLTGLQLVKKFPAFHGTRRFMCAYIHIYHTQTFLTAQRLYMNYRCYQITLQWNIFTQIGAVRSVDWIFIVGATAWRWLGEYVTLDTTFYSLLLVTGRIRDIGRHVLQSSFGNWANRWHWTHSFTVFYW